MDEVIGQAKLGIINHYDTAKYNMEMDCQDALEEMRKQKKDTKEVLKAFENLLEKNENILNDTIVKFNDFIKDKENLENKSINELMQLFIQSTVYLSYKDICTRKSKNLINEDEESDQSREENDKRLINEDEEQKDEKESDESREENDKRLINEDEEQADETESDKASEENENDKRFVGFFIHCNWFLTENQLNFIKVKLLKRKLTKDIKLCFNEGIIQVYCAFEDEMFPINHRLELKPFTSIKTLNINYCNITSIAADCFSKMDHLEVMHLRGNKFDGLEANSFKGLKSLKGLDLSRCGISTVPSGLFSHLDQLQALGLIQTPITHLESNVFVGLDSLVSLSLVRLPENVIIEDGVFATLKNLQHLNLSCNDRVHCLKSDAFCQLKSLIYLDIQSCNITSINKEWFSSHLENLEEINLESNQIENLEPSTFACLPKLKSLLFGLNQVFHNSNGETISRGEFEDLLRDLSNKNDVDVLFNLESLCVIN